MENVTEEQLIQMMVENEKLRQKIYEKEAEKRSKSKPKDETILEFSQPYTFPFSKVSIPVLPVPKDYPITLI